MQKSLNIISLSVLLFSSTTSIISQNIPLEYIYSHHFLLENKVIDEPNICDFQTFTTLTKEVLAKYAVNLYTNVLKKTDKVAETYCSFSDVSQINSTLTSFVIKACAYGFIESHGGKFAPKANVTRGQIITIISRIIDGSKFDTDDEDFYRDHAQNLINRNIITIINANSNVLKGDAGLMIERTIKNLTTITSSITENNAISCQVTSLSPQEDNIYLHYSIYPNPVIDIISLPEYYSHEYIIINSLGATVLEGTGAVINVSILPHGVYQLYSAHKHQPIKTRFMKQ